MATYITSDLHFSHKNLTKEGRAFLPTREHFESTDEMNEYLIKAHNEVIEAKDTVYILGDIALMNTKDYAKEAYELLNRLNGHLIIIKGNHDNDKLLKEITKNNYRTGFKDKNKFQVEEIGVRIKHNKMILHLTHYPMQTGGRGELYSIHGHIHGYESPYSYGLNVCIDSPELPSDIKFGEPISLDLACQLVKAKHDKYLEENNNNYY